jgi:hypothetical protein
MIAAPVGPCRGVKARAIDADVPPGPIIEQAGADRRAAPRQPRQKPPRLSHPAKPRKPALRGAIMIAHRSSLRYGVAF